MLGNKGKIGNINGAARPVNDLNVASEQQNSFANIDDTEEFAKLAKELNMSPQELRSSIDNGNIDPKKLIEALNKVSKVPGVTVDKVRAQKEIDKTLIGKLLNTVAEKSGYPNFNALIDDLPSEKTAGQTGEEIIKAVVDSGVNSTQSYVQLKPLSFQDALNRRRLDQVGLNTNTAA
jgi:hypothetical protein